MKSLTVAFALCLSATAGGQNTDKASGETKTGAATPAGDAKSSTEQTRPSAADAGLKPGHTMKPHGPTAPKPSTDATVK